MDEGKDHNGYNTIISECTNWISMDILDPTKVTQFALQNTVSITDPMITPNPVLRKKTKEEKAFLGGSMDGMEEKL